MVKLFLLSIGIACFSSMIYIIPVVIILQYALFKQCSLGKMFMVFVFAVYLMAVFSVVGIPTIYEMKVDFTFNLIPLIDIFNSPSAYIRNTILNIILFMPLGFLLPVIWKDYRSIKKTVLMGLAISVLIELLQIFSYRLTDVDDLITNTLGTFLGYYCGKRFSFELPLKILRKAENASKKWEPVIILIATFLIAVFFQPLVSNKIWDIVLSSSLWESLQ
ncbi:MAG: VanZ family protein [Lachnospiraceae bacterium]|nr:VanZ family protein [Lachnospiraceae bacterium]